MWVSVRVRVRDRNVTLPFICEVELSVDIFVLIISGTPSWLFIVQVHLNMHLIYNSTAVSFFNVL